MGFSNDRDNRRGLGEAGEENEPSPSPSPPLERPPTHEHDVETTFFTDGAKETSSQEANMVTGDADDEGNSIELGEEGMEEMEEVEVEGEEEGRELEEGEEVEVEGGEGGEVEQVDTGVDGEDPEEEGDDAEGP